MVNARLVGIGRVLLLGLAAWALAADAVAQPSSKADPESAVRLTAAVEQGTFNVGTGKAVGLQNNKALIYSVDGEKAKMEILVQTRREHVETSARSGRIRDRV